MNLNLILSDIYCKLKELNKSKFEILLNGSLIEPSATSINFTGSAIDNLFTSSGDVTVEINKSEQVQSDWLETDDTSVSFILNKPVIPPNLIFTGNVNTTQTGPNEITVEVLGSNGFTFTENVTNPFIPTSYPDITEFELNVSGGLNMTVDNSTTNKIIVDLSSTAITDTFWGRTGNAGTNASSNFLGTTDNVALTIRTNNVQRFRFSSDYSNFQPINSSLNIAGGNASIPDVNGNIAIGLGNAKAMELATSNSYNNIALGPWSLRRTTGYNNIFAGVYAGDNVTFSKDSIGIGFFALRGNGATNIDQSICIGPYSMRSTANSLWSIALGPGVMEYGSHHMMNIGIGIWALQYATMNADNISSNIGIGVGAAAGLTTGICNTIITNHRTIGYQNSSVVDTDSWNVYIGERAGGERGGGNKNVVIGAEAAGDVISGLRMRGERNILFGYNIGSTALNQDGCILIGANILAQSDTDAILNIGNVLFGSGLYNQTTTRSGVATATGRIGIGIETPTAVLDLRASTTLEAVMRLRVGVAPTTPNDGDIWLESNTSTGLKIRLNGTTYTVNLV